MRRAVLAYRFGQGGSLRHRTGRAGRRRSPLIVTAADVQPYSVAPWAGERIDPSVPPILQVLRGDFFCLPFGRNATPFRGESHPVHGETANARWHWESLETRAGRTCLHLSLTTKIRPGRVDKEIWLWDGENTVYSHHVVTGMSGPMNLGHHAMLKFPDRPGSGWRVHQPSCVRPGPAPAVRAPREPGLLLPASPGPYSSPWKRSRR